METTKSPSGQRLNPMALIDLFKAEVPKTVRPKSISPPTTKVTTKGLNWQQVDVSPVVKSKNSNSSNVTPKSTKASSRRAGRNASVSESPTLSQIFANHNAQHWQQQTSAKFQTPPRQQQSNGGLRRQQSASATLVGGNGRVYLQCNQKSNKENNNYYNFGRPATAFTSRPRGIDQSYIFAASKYCESPKSLPLPANVCLSDTEDEEVEEIKNLTLTQNASSPGRLMTLAKKKSLTKVNEEKNNDGLSDDAGIVFDLYGEDDSSSSDSASIPSSEGIVANSNSPVSDMEMNFMDYGHSVSGIRIHPLQLIASVASA